MEECEALCTRLVIMVNGQFKCLGSPQHLKSKFGNGYKLLLRLNDETHIEKLFEFMKKSFPTSINTETHKNLFEYILPFNSTKLSQIFGLIERNRESLDLKDYSITQTTLDQIFVNFAKSQNEESFMNENLSISKEFFLNGSDSDQNRETSFEKKNISQAFDKNFENLNLNSKSVESNLFNHAASEKQDKTGIEKMAIDDNNDFRIGQNINQLYDAKYYEDIFPVPLEIDKKEYNFGKCLI